MTPRTTFLTLAAFALLAPAAASGADADLDGVPDNLDNCPSTPNPSQNNSNFPSDNSGNACDPDYNNDGIVGIPDFARPDNFLLVFEGLLEVPRKGIYTFSLASDEIVSNSLLSSLIITVLCFTGGEVSGLWNL